MVIFHKHANTAVINSTPGARLGQIELSGSQVFDIGDGPAPVDLRVSAVKVVVTNMRTRE